tara:strand:+ start:261 stop:542 length:282 start_codon:yes stop_codon:yes gene_type:complete
LFSREDETPSTYKGIHNRREVGELIKDGAYFAEETHCSFHLGKENNIPRKLHLPTKIETIETTTRRRDLHTVHDFFKLNTLTRHNELEIGLKS